jgi:hypothetical protein
MREIKIVQTFWDSRSELRSRNRNENFFRVKVGVKSEKILHGRIAQKPVYILVQRKFYRNKYRKNKYIY